MLLSVDDAVPGLLLSSLAPAHSSTCLLREPCYDAERYLWSDCHGWRWQATSRMAKKPSHQDWRGCGVLTRIGAPTQRQLESARFCGKKKRCQFPDCTP